MNSAFLVDAYKIGHHLMYQDGIEKVYSNFTPRSNKYAPKGNNGKVLNFGQQAVIRYIVDHYNKNFFSRPKEEVIEQIRKEFSMYLGIDYVTSHFEDLHNLGYLPIKVKSLKEGTESAIKIPILTIVNTEHNFSWVPNYLETLISNLLWQPVTSASTALIYKKTALKWVKLTDENNIGLVEWMLHDFSMRGLTGIDAAVFSGMAHAAVFFGSDTLPVIYGARKYYDEKEFIVGSVAASEHSQMTAQGIEGELDVYKRLINKFPTGVLSLVSDSFDLWNVITNYLPQLKEQILARDGKLVIRPDCYSQDTLILTPNGWTEFNQLKLDSLVAQVNEDGSYSFVNPLKIVNEEYNGTMFHFKDFHGKMDLLVTPSHRMVYKQFDKWEIDFAEDCKPNNFTKSFIRSAKAVNKYRVLTNVERLNIVFQADRSKCTNIEKNIRFNFSEIKKIQRLKALLDEMKLSYKEYNLEDGRIEINIEYPLEQVSKNFDWVVTSDLCSNWCQEFIKELSYWDSYKRDENKIIFDTTDFSVSQVVELIALSAGYGCLTSKYEDNRKKIFLDVYTSNILLDNKLEGQHVTVEEVQYNGRIVCLTVPTGKIVVKRNKCIMVCGNSGDPADVICGIKIDKVKSLSEAKDRLKDLVYSIADELTAGECGDDSYSEIFNVAGTIFEVTVYPEWNRHDKTFYYVDNFSTSKVKTITLTSEQKGVIELLWDIFRGTVNEQGYKMLDPHIGVIQGEAVDTETQEKIYSRLAKKGFATTNIFIGIGSFSYQYKTRDSWGIACKCTAQQVNGELIPIFKDPITDSGMKKSAKGLLQVSLNKDNEYELKDNCTWEEEAEGELKVIFENGVFYNQTTLTEIRKNINEIK